MRRAHLGLAEVDNFAGNLVDDVAVALAAHRALVEGHDVLGEGAGLVGEYVLNLSELLVEGGGAGAGVRVRRRVIHLLVPVDEERLDEAYHLDAHVKAYGHYGVQDYRVREEDQEGYHRGAGHRLARD